MSLVDKSNTHLPLIAHVIYRLDVGGLENGLVNIINGLPEGRYRHAIICLTDYSEFHEKIRPDVTLVKLDKKPGKDPGLYWRLFKTIRFLQPDIIHTRNLAAVEAQFAAWLCGIKYRIHGLHGWDSDQAKDNASYLRLYKALNPLIHRYIPLSNELENFLAEKVGVDRSKITRICNGVDTRKFYPADKRSKDILPEGFNEPEFTIIGTVGRMAPVKDQLNLVDAFVHLVNINPEAKKSARLVLVGSGPMETEIRDRINQAGISDLIWLPGVRENIPALMRAIDIFVLPSQAEGISNTILEAMASGLPVVATDVGGNAQLVAQGETGMIVPKRSPKAIVEALAEYLSNPELMALHADASRQRAVEHFSIESMVTAYQQVYDSATR